MSKIHKIILLMFLILTSLFWVILRDVYQGVALLIFSLLAIWTIERRELDRNFYLALRKLYLCTDIEGFYEIVKRIENSALIKSSVLSIEILLKCIGQYHIGNRIDLLEKINRIKVPKRFVFWRYVYISLLDKGQISLSVLNASIKAVPAVCHKIATQRLILMKLFIEGHSDINEVITVRNHLTYNLLIAEATLYLAKFESNPRLINYYLKSVDNLKKEFVI